MWGLPHNTKMKRPRKVPPTTLESRERETTVSLLVKTKCAARGERKLSQWKKCLHVASWRRVPKVKVNKEPWIMVTLFISRLIKQLVFRCWKYCGWFISIPSQAGFLVNHWPWFFFSHRGGAVSYLHHLACSSMAPQAKYLPTPGLWPTVDCCI